MTDLRRRPPLVLTGDPAVGKSTTASLVARRYTRAAVIEVDGIRQLLVAGAAACILDLGQPRLPDPS